VSWQHIEGNTVPLFVLGFLAAYRDLRRFLAMTLIVILASGLTVWIFQSRGSLTVGASGLVFGYFGYVLARGMFDRNWVDIAAAAAAGAMYYYILAVALPGTPGISWLDHSGGLFGGILAAWVLRTRRPVESSAVPADVVPVGSSHDQAYGAFPVEPRSHAGTEAAG
jgi:membrane associated rhomboid family serine protease